MKALYDGMVAGQIPNLSSSDRVKPGDPRVGLSRLKQGAPQRVTRAIAFKRIESKTRPHPPGRYVPN
jgi:hypothetical protein